MNQQQVQKPRISLDDVLLPERRFTITSSASAGRLVSQETSDYILDTISRDAKLQALCLPSTPSVRTQTPSGILSEPPPPIRAVAPVWPSVERAWRPGLDAPPTGRWTKQVAPSPSIDWPLGPRTPDPYAGYCDPVEAYERICASIRQRQAEHRNPSPQPAKRLKVEIASASDPGSEIPLVNS